MLKVVVVVVTTDLWGLVGSGILFDCENRREPKLVMASSDKNVSSCLVNMTRCEDNGILTIRVANKSLKSLVNGRSVSVMRSVLDEVWYILASVSWSVSLTQLFVGESDPVLLVGADTFERCEAFCDEFELCFNELADRAKLPDEFMVRS